MFCALWEPRLFEPQPQLLLTRRNLTSLSRRESTNHFLIPLFWIRYNFSSIPNMMHDNVSHIKFSPAEVDRIWHPNLDTFTYNLQDWKYLYDPLWYQSLGILKSPTLRDSSPAQNYTTMYANKHWIVTLFCKFDFSKFPMDAHYCKFRQILGSTSEIVDLFLYPQSSRRYRNNKPKKRQLWHYEFSDFQIIVKPVEWLAS